MGVFSWIYSNRTVKWRVLVSVMMQDRFDTAMETDLTILIEYKRKKLRLVERRVLFEVREGCGVVLQSPSPNKYGSLGHEDMSDSS